ncbi:hemolysin family protein [Gracilimonas mengyeensis]|uniref:Protein involved in gliding motility GldE n=1 Tax=Gracilimonas mengyeensis TaxID=1302730 RepID=A0A521D6C6_9BACT|nr:CNNM domain-containing protein [Gracilimonas mengyeensis]SMO66651.1 protein involved in gliding motility GldE [Gracilimonas mengyeensis]
MDTLEDPFSFVQDTLMTAAGGFAETAIDPVVLTIELVFLFLGLAFSAIFSGSEVALFSLSTRMEDLKQDQSAGSSDDRILKMLDKPRRLLATILIGNTFANIIASVLAAVITGDIVAAYGFSEVLVFAVEVIVLTFMILILSEITPKIIAINNPIKVSRTNSAFIYSLFILLKPFAKLIADSTISLERYLPKPASKMTSEDIRTMAEVSEQEGSIKEDEREIIENVIGFGNISVREIMTSRVNIIAVSLDESLQDVLGKIRENGFSRMPLYENDIDNIIGVLYAKDVLPYLNAEEAEPTLNWKTVSRKALFIPATKRLDDLLRDFQQEKTHIAIVVDEYGGTEGIVTMDDILEEIVGDIADDSGEEVSLYTRFKSGIYIFDARVDLDDMEEILDTEITTDEDEFETLGGLIYHLTESLPLVGERITYKNMELTVHSVKNNRIRKVRVKVNYPQETESGSE